MKKVPISVQTHFEIDGIYAVIVREVNKHGNSAKVDCPKEYLGRTVYLVIL
jgi:putative transposon-encoded protein